MCELRDIVARAPGVYGVRFSGAGFRGCCAALCAAENAEAAAAEIRVATRRRGRNLRRERTSS